MIALLTLASCHQTGDHAEDVDTYTCPMHPTVISDRPGTCPVCGMELVRKARSGDAVEITKELATLLESPNESVIASITTIKGEYKPMPSVVKAQGIVTYDTRNIYTISSRVSGRLEKVYLKYLFQVVAKGQKIAEVYSPELITAQRELLFLLEHDAENNAMIDAGKRKLELLGLTKSQIDNLIQKRETNNTFSIYSQYAGYVITNGAAPTTGTSMPLNPSSASSGMGGDMASSPVGTKPSPTTSQAPDRDQFVREGDYISVGQPLFTVVNANALRIELDIPAHRATGIQKDLPLEVDYGNGIIRHEKIDFVQPFFSEGQDFVKIRVYKSEADNLRIGQLIHAEIKLPPVESLWVPRAAVLDLGNNKIIFIKDHGVFKPTKVITGITANDLIEIRTGLSTSDEIAANAQYLIDSESFIKTTR